MAVDKPTLKSCVDQSVFGNDPRHPRVGLQGQPPVVARVEKLCWSGQGLGRHGGLPLKWSVRQGGVVFPQAVRFEYRPKWPQ